MRFENLTIDRSSRQVRLDGKCVEMGAYDYDILLLLAEHMGDVVTRDLLSRALPRRRRVSQRNIDSHIKSLRKCLGREECIQCIRSAVSYTHLDVYKRQTQECLAQIHWCVTARQGKERKRKPEALEKKT